MILSTLIYYYDLSVTSVRKVLKYAYTKVIAIKVTTNIEVTMSMRSIWLCSIYVWFIVVK